MQTLQKYISSSFQKKKREKKKRIQMQRTPQFLLCPALSDMLVDSWSLNTSCKRKQWSFINLRLAMSSWPGKYFSCTLLHARPWCSCFPGALKYKMMPKKWCKRLNVVWPSLTLKHGENLTSASLLNVVRWENFMNCNSKFGFLGSENEN